MIKFKKNLEKKIIVEIDQARLLPVLVFVISSLFFAGFIKAEFEMNTTLPVDTCEYFYDYNYGYGYSNNCLNDYNYGYASNGDYNYGYGYNYNYTANSSSPVIRGRSGRIRSGGNFASIISSYPVEAKNGTLISSTQESIPVFDNVRMIKNYAVFEDDKKIVEKNDVAIEVLDLPKEDKLIMLDFDKSSEVRGMQVVFSADFLDVFYNQGNKNPYKMSVVSKEAPKEMQVEKMIGENIFTFNIYDRHNIPVRDYEEGIKITFDVSALNNRDELKIFAYNEKLKKWEILNDGGQQKGLGLSTIIFSEQQLAIFRVAKEDLDRDRDGIPDSVESLIGTSPDNADTDGDGYLDVTEVLNGYNPLGEGRREFSKYILNKIKK